MYKLSITGITAQRDMQSLIKFLLKVPGLTANEISRGLKVPPFEVLNVEQENRAEAIKNTLEKLGAVCVIENTAAIPKQKSKLASHTVPRLPKKIEKKSSGLTFWLLIIAILVFLAGLTFIFESRDNASSAKRAQAKTAPANPRTAAANLPPADIKPKYAKATSNDLKQTLNKNPYDVDAWKKLSENLEKDGDSVSAKIAKQSYDQAVKAQMVLSSLAKAFGNEARVEVREDAVYYRTSRDMSDREFYYEAAILRDSLNAKFPNKDLVIENYAPEKRVQTLRLPAGYKSTDMDAPISED